MTDRISIRGLKVEARIGATSEERARPRVLTIDVDLLVNLGPAGRSDELDDTVDYSDVAGRIDALMRDGEIKLLEHAAEKIVDEISTIPGVEGVSVEVSKKAPMPYEHERVSVRLERP